MGMAGQLTVDRLPDATVLVRVAGRWHLGGKLALPAPVDAAFDVAPPAHPTR